MRSTSAPSTPVLEEFSATGHLNPATGHLNLELRTPKIAGLLASLRIPRSSAGFLGSLALFPLGDPGGYAKSWSLGVPVMI